ncbi:(3S)-malyl-CoA thioesterase [Paracoccus haematequi]|uniref:(3S)-malyl-CoA thioesterase n=1 Tax=Paracoccus haematequi TaxID=2491866 RepID=A0A3S4GM38_9RHOB|nr:aldolase/citrate lyase family protein [Paracoccus haematequi]VDS07883.1 (3S)-malyl-CoA thioesterase [Paracoccus haematequi]
MSRVAALQALLFVPVGNERLLASALRHRPDAVILDLEDAVAPGEKPAARRALGAARAMVAGAGLACILRVNSGLRDLVADLDACADAPPDALLLPKCDSLRQVENAAELAAEGTELLALIEHPSALPALPAIAAHPRIAGLMLGSEDYCAGLGVSPDQGGLDLPVTLIAAACAARGLRAIGFPGSIANFRDLERYGAQIGRGLSLGANAVAAIHPAQLPVIREQLRPPEAEIRWAEGVILAAGGAKGAVAGGDGMIDAPVIRRAEAILSRARAARSEG